MRFSKNTIKTIVIVLSLASYIVSAQEFSLKQAQDYAIEHYYESVNAGLDIQKSKAKIWETTAIGLPQISAGGNYRYVPDLEFDFNTGGSASPADPNNPIFALFAADNISQIKLQGTQLIFDGSYIVGLQASKKYHEFSKVGKEKTDNDVRNNVSSAYYLVLVADENIKVLNVSFEMLETSLKETKAVVKEGFMDETELDQLELMKSDLESSMQSAKQSKDVAIKMLKLNMGMSLSETINLSDSLKGIVEQINMDALLAKNFDVASNPDLKVMEVQRDLLKLDLKRYKAQRLPTIAGFYSYQNTAYQLDWDWYKDASWFDQQNLGLSISVPLISSGKQGSIIKQSKLELTKMENSLTFAQQAMTLQYQNAQNNLNTKNQNFQSAGKSLALANKIYDRIQKKHKEGLASSFELSQMKNQVLQSQGKYIQSLFDLLNTKAELDRLQNI